MMSLLGRLLLLAALFTQLWGRQLKADAAGLVQETAKIEITSNTPIRTIPATLFGANLEWIWNENLLWDSALGAPDPAHAGLFKQLAPKILRFPGGFFADYYNWRNGVGPQVSRPATASMPGGATSAHTFGTEEALELTRMVDGELLITVNAGTGSAGMAADWVRYVNRSARAVHVRYWEIGNELYLPASSLGGITVVTLSAEQYARRVIEFATAMKAVDPDIKVGAILDESLATVESSGWTKTVLGLAGNHIDFVSIHNSYAPVLATGGDKALRTVYAAMLASPFLIARNLDSLSTRLDQLVPARRGKIAIAVTEWGPFFHFDSRHRYYDHVKTMGSALFTASALMAFARSPRTEIAAFFKLNDFLNMGLIGYRGNEPSATSPYFAFQLMARHLGGAVLPTKVQSAGFDTEAIGTVPALTAMRYLDVLATLSADRSAILVTVVNKNFEAAIPAEIDLGTLSRSAPGLARTLRATALDAHTGTTPLSSTGIQVAYQARDFWNSRFSWGSPNEVYVETVPLTTQTSRFVFTFPAMSLTTLEIPLSARGGPSQRGQRLFTPARR